MWDPWRGFFVVREVSIANYEYEYDYRYSYDEYTPAYSYSYFAALLPTSTRTCSGHGSSLSRTRTNTKLICQSVISIIYDSMQQYRCMYSLVRVVVLVRYMLETAPEIWLVARTSPCSYGYFHQTGSRTSTFPFVVRSKPRRTDRRASQTVQPGRQRPARQSLLSFSVHLNSPRRQHARRRATATSQNWLLAVANASRNVGDYMKKNVK
eukprot:scaffold97600_cov21-Prasinocladus_malaysianus.AAC.1